MKSVLFSLLMLVALTGIPGLELRASIPYGVFSSAVEQIGFAGVAAVCIVCNIFVGVAVFALLDPAMKFVRRWGWFERIIWPRFLQKQAKLQPYVEKYGELGLALFIGIPLPGTGAYSGAVGAYLLGMSRKKFWVANALGVLIAGVCVSTICWLILRGAIAEDSILRALIK